MRFAVNRKSQARGFQMTPMLDVVFLLLCFFVTASVYSQWEYQMDIQLPSAVTGQAPARLPGEIIVNISAEGEIMVNENVLTPEQLLARCRLLSENFPGNPVVIRGDRKTPYEYVLQVVDICRQADIDNVSFATQMAEE